MCISHKLNPKDRFDRPLLVSNSIKIPIHHQIKSFHLKTTDLSSYPENPIRTEDQIAQNGTYLTSGMIRLEGRVAGEKHAEWAEPER
jgi:hypothetical protein